MEQVSFKSGIEWKRVEVMDGVMVVMVCTVLHRNGDQFTVWALVKGFSFFSTVLQLAHDFTQPVC